MSSYQHNPFKAAKRRKRKKSFLGSPAKRRVGGLSLKKESKLQKLRLFTSFMIMLRAVASVPCQEYIEDKILTHVLTFPS